MILIKGGFRLHKTKNFSANYQDCILLTTQNLQSVLSCGRVSAVKIGTEAGARVQIGKRVLWNREKIKLYLEQIAG